MTERLVRLFLMLGSEHDGEVVNAARHLGRWLRDNETDWHALAEHMERFRPGAKPLPEPRRKSPPGFTFRTPTSVKPKPKPTPRPQQGITLQQMVSDLNGYADGSKPMTTSERAFIDKLQYRFESYGGKTYVHWSDIEATEKLHMKYITRTSTHDY